MRLAGERNQEYFSHSLSKLTRASSGHVSIQNEIPISGDFQGVVHHSETTLERGKVAKLADR